MSLRAFGQGPLVRRRGPPLRAGLPDGRGVPGSRASHLLPEDVGRREHDNFYYLSSNFYIALRDNIDLILSYTYEQNASNNPLVRFCDSIYSAGLSIRF